MLLNCHYCLKGSLINFRIQTKVDKSSDMITASGELDAGHYGSILLARKLMAVRGAGKTYDGIYYVKCVTQKIKRGNILTKSDLVKLYSEHYRKKYLVSEFMTKDVFTISPSHSLHTALLLTIKNRISPRSCWHAYYFISHLLSCRKYILSRPNADDDNMMVLFRYLVDSPSFDLPVNDINCNV